MAHQKPRLPSMMQIVFSLSLFLLLAYLFTAIFHVEIQLVLFIGWFMMIALGVLLGYKYRPLEKSILDGISRGLIALLILIAVGALSGTWIKGGIVPGIIYYGLEILHPKVFLPACLIICSITSIVTGTSWGTAATTGIAMMGIGLSMDIPAPLVAGAVLSGAYFGDKLSPMSDSTVLTSTIVKVDLMVHIRGMLPISGTGFLVALLAFAIAGSFYSESISSENIADIQQAIASKFDIGIHIMIPICLVLFLLAIKEPAFLVICFGAVLGSMWMIFFEDYSIIDSIKAIYKPDEITTNNPLLDTLLNRGGIESMFSSIIIIIFGLGLGGIMEEIGILKVVTERISRFIHGIKSLTIMTILCGFIINVFGSAMYVALLLTPKMMLKNYDRLKVPRYFLSRNTEFGGTLTSGMVPWSDNGVFMTMVLGVPTLSYLPYMWLNFACIGLAIIFSFFYRPSTVKENNS